MLNAANAISTTLMSIFLPRARTSNGSKILPHRPKRHSLRVSVQSHNPARTVEVADSSQVDFRLFPSSSPTSPPHRSIQVPPCTPYPVPRSPQFIISVFVLPLQPRFPFCFTFSGSVPTALYRLCDTHHSPNPPLFGLFCSQIWGNSNWLPVF